MALSDAFKRVIVLDALSPVGCYAVEALLDSPILSLPVVAAAWRAAPDSSDAATSVLAALAKEPKRLPLRIVRSAKELNIDPVADLLVYVTRSFEARVLEEAAGHSAKQQGGAVSDPTLLLITSDGAHAMATSTLEGLLKRWHVVHVKTISLAPPTTARLRSDTAHCLDLVSPFEWFALGVALGVTRFFGVNASHPADIAPIDVALHTAAVALGLHGSKFPASSSNSKHLSMSLIGNPDQSLVWGMVGEYVLDYYGRFGHIIAKAMPADTFNKDPTVAFNAHFPDLWNYGLALTTPLEMYRQSSAARTKTHLLKYPNSTTAERMSVALRQIDAALDQARRHTSATRAGYDNTSYLMLLRRLSVSREHLPLYLASALTCIRWEMYVKRVALRVLHYIVMVLLRQEVNPQQFPTPLPFYHNELVFQGPERAPEPNLVLRRWMDDIHMVLRGGQQPNGLPINFVPGGTERIFLGILAQPHVQRLISRLADEQFLPREDVEARAMVILRQIGDTLNQRQTRTVAYAMRKIFATLYTRVSIADNTFDTLFGLFNRPRTSVVLIPSHRSYMDFLVLSYILLVMGLPLPHICAGEDFLGLGKISDLLRGGGAFFMRRSFKNDTLYGALFKEYVRNLVRRGQAVEFFVEGTRSRTQKTMPPKVGLLKIVCDAFFEPHAEINDVVLVPISLSYEKILEGNLYANELLGIPKPKETVGNLIRSASVLREKYGSFNVNIGTPISLADFAADPDQVPVGFQPFAGVNVAPSVALSDGSDKGTTSPSLTPLRTLSRLAWRLTHELQRNTVVTPTALIAAVLLHMFDHSELRESGVPMAAVASNAEWLRSAVLHSGGLMSHRYATFDGLSLLRYAVKHLAPHVWISPLSRVYLATGSIASVMLLTLYTNQLVHLFGEESTLLIAASSLASSAFTAAPPTLTESALKVHDPTARISTAGEGDGAGQYHVSRSALMQQTASVRSLLHHELPDFQPSNPVDPSTAFSDCIGRLRARKVVVGDENGSVHVHFGTFANFATQLTYPWIESYFVLHVCLHVLRKTSRIPENVLLALAHDTALMLYDRKLVQYSHCSSKETLRNALSRALEKRTVVFERADRISTVALPTTPNDNPKSNNLDSQLHEINALRSRPCSQADLSACVAVATERYSAMHKLPQASKL